MLSFLRKAPFYTFLLFSIRRSRGIGLKLRVIVGVTIFFVLVVGAISLLLFGPAFLSAAGSGNGNTSPALSGSTANTPIASAPHNVIAIENAQPGTTSWIIPGRKAATTQIQAYADVTSVQPGQNLTFYVSTQIQGIHYSIDIYRLGWYGGDGARLIASTTDLIGHAQGYYDPVNHRLVNCSTCYVNKNLGLVEANWHPSYTLTVPSNWTTGVYLAKFTDANAMQTYATFDVKGNFLSTYVAVTPNTTDEAYNTWGGYSLYEADGSGNASASEQNSTIKAVKVSFDRPYSQATGSGNVLLYEINAIRWMERQGYNLSYISSVDLHENPSLLLKHKAYLSLGHDEYWTKEMRDGVENARDHGVSLAFFGADAAYWQMRFEPDSAGVPDRTVVCYKVGTGSLSLALDPFYGRDNTRVTAEWRDPILDRPENALIGIMFSDLTHVRQGFPWEVDTLSKSPLLNGTELLSGQQYGCDIVGYEWDRIYNNGATPQGLQVLGTTPTQRSDAASGALTPDISNTTYYIAPSGAMVFATGSIYWTIALDSYRYQVDNLCANQSPVTPGIQKLMANVMVALVNPHSFKG